MPSVATPRLPRRPQRHEDRIPLATALLREQAAAETRLDTARWHLVLAARRAGMQWTEIGEALGANPDTVRWGFAQALKAGRVQVP